MTRIRTALAGTAVLWLCAQTAPAPARNALLASVRVLVGPEPVPEPPPPRA